MHPRIKKEYYKTLLSVTGKITEEEFITFPTASIDSYMNYIKDNHPKHKDRYSSQTWIEHGKTKDKMVKKLTQR